MSQAKIFKAISQDDVKGIRKVLLKEGGDANAVDPKSFYQDTALIRAADRGCVETVRELLLFGAVVDKANAVGDTALVDAARYSCVGVVRVLIEHGATVDRKTNNGTTALMSAAKCGCLEIVKILLSAGADVDITNKNGETALSIAKDSPYSRTVVVDFLEEAKRNKERTRSLTEAKPSRPVRRAASAPLCRHQRMQAEENSARGKGNPQCPLINNPSYPDVTFLGEPEVREITHEQEHYDFENGVEVTVPTGFLRQDSSCSVSVQPGFASDEVFSMPSGVLPASPSFLISQSDSDVDSLTLSIEHHIKVNSERDAQDLLFLQADPSPKFTDSKPVYHFQEVPEFRSEFKPGDNKGKLSITKRFSKKFLKIGFRKRAKKQSTNSILHTVNNGEAEDYSPAPDTQYTVRVYRSPQQTTRDRIAIVVISLFGKVYSKFWSEKDILDEYPEISPKAVDWTQIEPVGFTKNQATLIVGEASGWRVNTDKKFISKRAVDLPQSGQFRPEDLPNYPPRIVCTFHSPKNWQVRDYCTCVLSLLGFDEDVSVSVPLIPPSRGGPQQQNTPFEAWQLKNATDVLKASILSVSVKHTELGLAVLKVVGLMENIARALSSSSLEDLVGHVDEISKEIGTVLALATTIALNCANKTIKSDIETCVTKIESLTHQFCQVAKAKLKFCQGTFEGHALSDLADSGASVIRAINYLFHDLHTLNTIIVYNSTAYTVLSTLGEAIVTEFSRDPKSLAVSLFAAGLISNQTLQETNELNEIRNDKGRRLYVTVLDVIRSNPDTYSKLLSILEQNGTMYNDLLISLDRCWQRLVHKY